MKKRLSYFILALIMTLGNIIPITPPAVADETPAYFVGVNDVLLTLQASSLPIWEDRYICLPYTVFDSATIGSRLGLSSSYQRSAGLVTIYNSQKSIVFDIAKGTCTDMSNNQVYHSRAVVRDGMPFIHMTIVCDVFGLSYSYHNISYGYLVRITSANASMTASQFIQHHSSSMERMLVAFRQGTAGTVATIPDTPLCLGFTLTEENLDFTEALETWKVKGLFFFTEEQLATRGDYLRKLYGTGHSIGIRLTSEEDMEEELSRCLALLRAQTQSTTQVLLLPNQDSGAEFAEEGFVLWQGGTGTEVTSPSTVVQGLKQGSNMVYLTLPQEENTSDHWTDLMTQLGEKGFIPQIPTESIL